jgi:hypothetical protein
VISAVDMLVGGLIAICVTQTFAEMLLRAQRIRTWWRRRRMR